MDLYESLMHGMELIDPRLINPQPVDFVVTAPLRVLVLYADWWRVDWGPENGLEVFESATLQERADGWIIDQGADPDISVSLRDPSDELMADVLRTARYRMDLNRGAYLEALDLLKESEEDFDFTHWIDIVLSRPKIDPVDEYKRIHLSDRKIGSISLTRGDNEIADVLVLDNLGDAATVQGNPWLESLAERWAAMDDRPDLEAFLSWVADQRAYGPFGVSDPRVFTASGGVEEIAQKQMAV